MSENLKLKTIQKETKTQLKRFFFLQYGIHERVCMIVCVVSHLDGFLSGTGDY